MEGGSALSQILIFWVPFATTSCRRRLDSTLHQFVREPFGAQHPREMPSTGMLIETEKFQTGLQPRNWRSEASSSAFQSIVAAGKIDSASGLNAFLVPQLQTPPCGFGDGLMNLTIVKERLG